MPSASGTADTAQTAPVSIPIRAQAPEKPRDSLYLRGVNDWLGTDYSEHNTTKQNTFTLKEGLQYDSQEHMPFKRHCLL